MLQDDITLAVKSLCQALYRMLSSAHDKPEGAGSAQPLMKTYATLEAEILRLLPLADPKQLREITGPLVLTGSRAICAQLPRRPHCRPYPVRQRQFQVLLGLGPEYLTLACERGLNPPTSADAREDALVNLMKRCSEGGRQDAWQQAAHAFFRADCFLRDILWYARETSQLLTPGLSVFLAGLVEEQVAKYPGRAQEQLRGAIIGNCSFDAGALVLAGVPLPEKEEIQPRGPKIRALFEMLSSNHGKLAFISQLGPLSRYLDPAFPNEAPILDGLLLQPSPTPS